MSSDPLKFSDTKSYKDRVSKSVKSTGLNDAIRTAHGKLDGHKIVISCMDFSFIGGSMGSVVGEKISRAIDLSKNKIPYISLMTDPTTGGVSASYAMLGDFNIAEPGALIGFAGPRVIKETIGSNLPKGFQRSEFLVDHGFLDFIVDRRDLKNKISKLLKMLKN